MGYSAEILARGLPTGTTYQELYKAIWARHFPTEEADPDEFWRRVFAMSQGECAFVLTNVFFCEVNNGGLDQFFDNSGFQRAHETVEALRLCGLAGAGDFLGRAITIAEIPYPLPSDYEYDYDEERSAALRNLDTEYYRSKADHGFEDAVIAYVRHHPDQFT
jgi:hypothetical protein